MSPDVLQCQPYSFYKAAPCPSSKIETSISSFEFELLIFPDYYKEVNGLRCQMPFLDQ